MHQASTDIISVGAVYIEEKKQTRISIEDRNVITRMCFHNVWGQILLTSLENSYNDNANAYCEDTDLVWRLGSMWEAYVYGKCMRNINGVILTTKLSNISFMGSCIL